MTDRKENSRFYEFIYASSLIGFCGGVVVAILIFIVGVASLDPYSIFISPFLAIIFFPLSFLFYGVIGYPVYIFIMKNYGNNPIKNILN